MCISHALVLSNLNGLHITLLKETYIGMFVTIWYVSASQTKHKSNFSSHWLAFPAVNFGDACIGMRLVPNGFEDFL